MKYFNIFDRPRNASKIDLSVSPKSVLEFKTQIKGTKFYLASFWFCKKS